MKLKMLMNVTQKIKIRHRNVLNLTLAQLPFSVKRAIYMALTSIDNRKPIEKGRIFRIRADDLAYAADIEVSVAYKKLKNGAKLLRSSSLSLIGDDIVAISEYL